MNLTLPAEARALEAKAMTEREFQSRVIELACACNWWVAHFRPGKTSRVDRRGREVWVTPMQGDPGFPDLVLARSGPKVPRLILAELKKEGARLTDAQQAWAVALGGARRRDWEYYVWTPSMMPEILEVLLHA